MSKVLVVPDIHLKPELFTLATSALEKGTADRAVVLGDLVDDWGCKHNVELYEKTFEAALQFAKQFPDTLWCYGNHDLSYLGDMPQSGYSYDAQLICKEKLNELYGTIEKIASCSNPVAVVQAIDHVWFSHAGVTEVFVKKYLPEGKPEWMKDQTLVRGVLNILDIERLWYGSSPLWARPQENHHLKMYDSKHIMQVVGHTPMPFIRFDRKRNLLSTDVFSLYRDRTPIGERRFAVVNTEQQTWEYAK